VGSDGAETYRRKTLVDGRGQSGVPEVLGPRYIVIKAGTGVQYWLFSASLLVLTTAEMYCRLGMD